MKSSFFIPAIVVLAGAVIILISFRAALRIRNMITRDLLRKWLGTLSLMVFFLFGYIVFFFILLGRLGLSPEKITALVFVGGAIFVYLVMRITETTLLRISDKDRKIREYAEGLALQTQELEREIAERSRAEDQATKRLQNLSALHTIDMIISSSLDLHLTLKFFLEQVISQLRVDAASVLLLDRHTQVLKYEAGCGFSTPAIEKTSQRVGEGTAGLAALEQNIVSIPSIAREPEKFDRADVLEEEGFISYYAVPLIAKAQVKGVLEIFHRTVIDPDPEWMNFLKALALQAAIAVDHANLFQELQRTNIELLLAYDSTLEGWSRALDLRDQETEGHTRRVAEKTTEIARMMRMTEENLVHARRGALLHDIGKMSIPDSILFKEGPLTEEEMEIMRRHPIHAFELLSPIIYLRPALDIPYCHHERWDGSGYPRGLKGEQIPLAARIFAVVDTWDALCVDRRYHAAWSREKACEHILAHSGTHFDPNVVEVFLKAECGGKSETRCSPFISEKRSPL